MDLKMPKFNKYFWIAISLTILVVVINIGISCGWFGESRVGKNPYLMDKSEWEQVINK